MKELLTFELRQEKEEEGRRVGGPKELKEDGRRTRCTGPPMSLKSIWFLLWLRVTGAQVSDGAASPRGGRRRQNSPPFVSPSGKNPEST